MKKLILVCFFILLLILPTMAQQAKYFGSSSIELLLTTQNSELRLTYQKTAVSYEPSLGYFAFEINPRSLKAIRSGSFDKQLYRAFKKIKINELVIYVYVDERPLDLSNLQGEGVILPARVKFGSFSFQNEAKLWGRVTNDVLRMKFVLVNNFLPTIKLPANKPFEIKQMEIYSDHIEIYDFFDLMN